MKKVFYMCVIAGSIFIVSCAQNLNESQVSEAAKTAFNKNFPNTIAKWEKEDANYEANFKQNGKTMSAIIQTDGMIVETESDIETSELPSTVRSYIKDHYNGAKIKEASTIVKANGDMNFEALVNGKDLIFDVNGKFIQEAKD